jgi:hypothetical protein
MLVDLFKGEMFKNYSELFSNLSIFDPSSEIPPKIRQPVVMLRELSDVLDGLQGITKEDRAMLKLKIKTELLGQRISNSNGNGTGLDMMLSAVEDEERNMKQEQQQDIATKGSLSFIMNEPTKSDDEDDFIWEFSEDEEENNELAQIQERVDRKDGEWQQEFVLFKKTKTENGSPRIAKIVQSKPPKQINPPKPQQLTARQRLQQKLNRMEKRRKNC